MNMILLFHVLPSIMHPKYYIDGETRYLIGSKSYTESELQAMREETAKKDEKAGYNDRRVGVYDKWDRYNRAGGTRTNPQAHKACRCSAFSCRAHSPE